MYVDLACKPVNSIVQTCGFCINFLKTAPSASLYFGVLVYEWEVEPGGTRSVSLQIFGQSAAEGPGGLLLTGEDDYIEVTQPFWPSKCRNLELPLNSWSLDDVGDKLQWRERGDTSSCSTVTSAAGCPSEQTSVQFSEQINLANDGTEQRVSTVKTCRLIYCLFDSLRLKGRFGGSERRFPDVEMWCDVQKCVVVKGMSSLQWAAKASGISCNFQIAWLVFDSEFQSYSGWRDNVGHRLCNVFWLDFL